MNNSLERLLFNVFEWSTFLIGEYTSFFNGPGARCSTPGPGEEREGAGRGGGRAGAMAASGRKVLLKVIILGDSGCAPRSPHIREP